MPLFGGSVAEHSKYQFKDSMGSSRQRDIFPLPVRPSDFDSGAVRAKPFSHLSRKAQRRILKKGHLSQECSSISRALNSLAGVEATQPCGDGNAAQQQCYSRILQAVKDFPEPPESMDSSGALQELRGMAPYDQVATTVIPYFPGCSVSLPASGSPVDLVGLLGRLGPSEPQGVDFGVLPDLEARVSLHDKGA